MGGESSLYFPTADDNSDDLLRLLEALDSQGWPLLSPMKLQLEHCDKCSQVFCSTLNYRRHIRVHHRLQKLDKDFTKSRDLVGAYWDKLSAEEAKEVVSLENVLLEEVPAASILKSLTTLIQNQRLYSFPPHYMMSGAVLLGIAQSRPSSFPISSQLLFGFLDDASEKTWLCGTTESVKKYVFDGDAGKICLELKNLVACTGFLIEQKLVKAWLTDQDAEALRCQEQLVEEEKAAQKRQAEILGKKRQKKLRQKEQKARERREKAEAEIKGYIDRGVKALSLTEASSDTHNLEAHNPNAFSDNVASPVPPQYIDTNEEIKVDTPSEYNTIPDQNLESKSAEPNVLHTDHISPLPKVEVNQKAEAKHDNKVLTPKSEEKTDKGVLKTTQEKQADQLKSQEILIGSIPVNIDTCKQSEGNTVASQKDSMVENVGKPMETEDEVPVQSDETEGDAVHGNVPSLSTGRTQGRMDSRSLQSFFQDARAFLDRRWGETISSEHVILNISSDSEESSSSQETQD
ncbi:hypothetical protein DEO72_LG5g2908 [Vigna unguiculata]|uniref:C2H2-type domain-containing protein n=1 Tax=Vigna unguiculata TaxID=3917 RepID=A0A4D6M0M9_VIGUN|nr:hypothetical protein DEO72_LG5g2908 [Vigna unguiculata]